MATDRPAQEIEGYGARGVWVPRGMTAYEIMEGAKVLEERFGVPPYESRQMVREVLSAIRRGASDSAKVAP